jgi:hypothetical protein
MDFIFFCVGVWQDCRKVRSALRRHHWRRVQHLQVLDHPELVAATSGEDELEAGKIAASPASDAEPAGSNSSQASAEAVNGSEFMTADGWTNFLSTFTSH